MKNRFAELGSPGKFQIKEEELTYGEDEVLVRISACGVCMWEMYHFEGKLGKCPQRLGHEPSGVIEEVGKNVKGFKVGDRVTGLFGLGFASHAVASPENLIKIPDGIKTEHALGEPLKCAVTCSRAAMPEFGDYVLLIGCGFMGLLTLAGIRGNAPAEIIAVDLVDSRLKLAKGLGATLTLNPAEQSVEEKVREITKGRGVDVAIEATGKPEPIGMASNLLRNGRARLVLVGYHGTPSVYDLGPWAKGTIVLNPHPGYCLDQMDEMRRAIEGLKRGVFPMEKLITHRFKLEEIGKAFETARSHSEEYVKGIVIP